MAKTIGRIALVAAAVAVSVGSFGIGAAITGALGATIGGAVTTAVVGLGVASLSGLLGLGPKAPKPQATETTVKSPQPPRVYGYGRRRLHGSKILFQTNSAGTTIDVYAYADGEADGVEQIYLNDDKVTIVGETVQALPDKKYQRGLVKAGFRLGLATETAFASVIAALPGIWTANHRGDGVVTGYLLKGSEKEKDLLTTYPQGDNVEMSAVFRLQKCFDPRDGVTRWTRNPVLQMMHYLMVQRKYDYQKRFAPTLQYWIDAANICDEPVPLKGGGTEPRYVSDVVYDATALSKEVRGSLGETFDGWIGQRGDGAIVIYAGKLYAPTVTIGPDEIYDYSMSYGVEGDSRVDQLSVSYISAEHDYNTVETTPWGGEAGALRTDSFAPQTGSYSQNRRLAKRFYARANEMDRGTITTNLAGRKARGHRYIRLLIEESGIVWFDGIAEVTNIKRDFQAGGLTFDWIAVDQNIDAWNPATEEGEPAPVGNRIAPQPLDTPTISTANTFFDRISDGGTGARIRIEVATPAHRADYTWYARWRVLGDSAWNEQAYPNVGSGSVVLETGFVPVDLNIETAVAYSQGDGRVSDYSAPEIVDSDTQATPPEAAQAPTLTNWVDTLDMIVPIIGRATNYIWRIYASDGATLLRTVTTSTRSLFYSAEQAAQDGVTRNYIITVAGINSAGEGVSASSGLLTNPAPEALDNASAAGGQYNAQVTADPLATIPPDFAGYVAFVAPTAGFNPSTQGQVFTSRSLPIGIYGLAAGTYYARIAAYDYWTRDPARLNLSSELSFTITTGNGGNPGTGGGGGNPGNPSNPIP